MAKFKVIIADDMKPILMQHEIVLKSFEEFEIVGTASNGEEVLNLINEIKPDLVITDNQMPLLNGFDVIKKINDSDMENKPTFLLVTGDYGYEFNKKAYEIGTFKVISKSDTKRELNNALNEFLCLQNTNESVIINGQQNTFDNSNNEKSKKGEFFKKIFSREKR